MFIDFLQFLSWEWLVAFHLGVAVFLFLPLWFGIAARLMQAMRSWLDREISQRMKD